jgi:predicted sugar kinase
MLRRPHDGHDEDAVRLDRIDEALGQLQANSGHASSEHQTALYRPRVNPAVRLTARQVYCHVAGSVAPFMMTIVAALFRFTGMPASRP